MRPLRLAVSAALALVLLATSPAAARLAASAQPVRSRAFVALEDAGQVAVMGGPPWRVLLRVSVPAGPHNVAASPDGEFVAVTSPPAGAVTLIAPAPAQSSAPYESRAARTTQRSVPKVPNLWNTSTALSSCRIGRGSVIEPVRW